MVDCHLPRLSRRDALIGSASIGVAANIPQPAQAFIPLLFGSALRAIGATALRAGATRVAASTVGRQTIQRTATSSALIRSAHPGRVPLRTSESYFGTFGREFARGAGNEFGKRAASSLWDYMSQGFGAVEGTGRPHPGYPEDDVCYAAFPNEGPVDDPVRLGCIEIYVLAGVPHIMSDAFGQFGFNDHAFSVTVGIYPIAPEQQCLHDGDWISIRPAVFRSPGAVVRMSSHRASGRGRYVAVEIRLGGSASARYATEIPVAPQFG